MRTSAVNNKPTNNNQMQYESVFILYVIKCTKLTIIS